MNREEFKRHALKIYGDSTIGQSIIDGDEPFWIPEIRDGWQASYFAATKVLPYKRVLKSSVMRAQDYENSGGFWGWCNTHLTKIPMCFMCDIDNNIEWWGFNTEEDRLLFLVKWA